jgi:hypothetical protein
VDRTNVLLVAVQREVLAKVLLAGGQHAAALTVLDSLLGSPSFVSPAWLRAAPPLAPLLGNPRFERMVAKQ